MILIPLQKLLRMANSFDTQKRFLILTKYKNRKKTYIYPVNCPTVQVPFRSKNAFRNSKVTLIEGRYACVYQRMTKQSRNDYSRNISASACICAKLYMKAIVKTRKS